MNAFLRVTSAITLFFYLNATTFPAWADAVSDSAKQGNAFAKEAMSAFQAPSVTDSAIVFGSGAEASSINLSDVFPGASSTNAPDLEQLYGNDQGTLDYGTTANVRLQEESSMEGEAYRLIKGTAQLQRPDITNDPLWTNTDTVFSNQDLFEKEFADCSEENTYNKITLTKRVPDYKTCERINKPAGSCTITHSIEIEPEPTDLYFLIDNSASMDSIIQALRVNVGRVAELLGVNSKGKLRLGGAVTRNGQYAYNHIPLTDNINAFQAWIDSVRVNGGPTENFNAVRWAINNNAWRDNVNKVFVIVGNEDSGGSGGSPRGQMNAMGFTAYIFHDNAGIKSLGVSMANTFTAGQLFKVAQFLTVVRDRWDPPSCVQAALSTRDGFCTGEYTAVSGTESCVNLSGFDVCVGDPIYNKLSEPPIPDVGKMVLRVDVGKVECPFNVGQMDCYTDASGVEQCPENSEDTCTVTHPLSVAEVPLMASVAVEDMPGTGETNRVRITFTDGKAVNTSRSAGFDSSIRALQYDNVCKKNELGGLLPHKFAFVSGVGVWDEHSAKPKTNAGGTVNVVQMPSCSNNLTAIVDIKDDGSGTPGNYYARDIAFKMIRLDNEQWGPASCLESAKKVAEGTCSEGGTLKVTGGVESGCLPVKGVQVCPGDTFYNAMKPSPIKGIDKLAQAVKVDGCVDNSLRATTCEELENTSGCGFISTQCIGNATGQSGYCYVQEEVWDCGVDVPIESATASTSYQCDGQVRCLGTECYNPVDEKSSDFAYAAAALQIAQFAEHDLDCGENPEDGSLDCKIWKGEIFECKKALGGWVDCCEAPDGVSLFDYMNLTWNTLKAASMTGALGEAAQSQGLMSYGADLVAQGYNAVVSSVWTSAAESGAAEVAETAVLSELKQMIMDKVAAWTYETFGQAAAQTIFVSTTTATAADGTTTAASYTGSGGATFGPMIAGALSVIMIAYMVYQIANILVQIIWECEEREFELGAKKQTKLCTFVGSYCADDSAFGCIEKREAYCCFNSPLGRIMQEQARPQLGRDFGEAENPECSGLEVSDLAKIDWSKIDISEWVGIMNLTGVYPTIGNMNLDKLTGQNSRMNYSGTRLDSADRNVKRVENVGDFTEIRKNAEDDMRQTID